MLCKVYKEDLQINRIGEIKQIGDTENTGKSKRSFSKGKVGNGDLYKPVMDKSMTTCE